MALAIAAAGIWAYWTSFPGVLVLDDIGSIAWNSSLRSLDTALSPPPGTTLSGRPIANLSFALNYALAPADVRDV
jgi:hypothetical protein